MYAPAATTPDTSTVSVDVPRILATIRARESGGDYNAKNPSSSASGAYQIIDSTWGGFAGYRRAADAPPAIQDAKATAMVTSYLARYGGKLEAVPATWYVGHYDPANLDYVPGGGNTLSVRQYINAWMGTYNAPAPGGAGTTAVPTDAQGAVGLPGGGTIDKLSALADFVGLLTEGHTWVRIGLVLGGALAIAGGLSLMGVDMSGVNDKLTAVTNIVNSKGESSDA